MANEQRLIDANALIEHLTNCKNQAKGIFGSACVAIKCFVEQMPTVDAVEVVRGYDTGRCRIFHCSICGYGVNDIYQEDERNYPVGEFNYCPNCGAKMDGDGNEDEKPLR